MLDEQRNPTRTDATETDTANSPRPTSTRRRALLRAAASAAPVMATLPNGAALASASTLQCVTVEQAGNNAQGLVPDVFLDNYMRIPGKLQRYIVPNSSGTGTALALVYYVPVPEGGVTKHVYVYGSPNLVGETPGSWFDPGATGVSLEQQIDADFLYVYYASQSPITSNTQIKINPSTGKPTECVLESIPDWPGPIDGRADTANWATGPSQPRDCFFPIAIKADPDTAGNTPVTASCLTSFQREL